MQSVKFQTIGESGGWKIGRWYYVRGSALTGTRALILAIVDDPTPGCEHIVGVILEDSGIWTSAGWYRDGSYISGRQGALDLTHVECQDVETA